MESGRGKGIGVFSLLVSNGDLLGYEATDRNLGIASEMNFNGK